MHNKKIIVILLLSFWNLSHAFAQMNQRLPRYQIPEAARAELTVVARLLELYLPGEQIKDVLGSPYQYAPVAEIPDQVECKERLQYSQLPVNSTLVQVACTVGRLTYIKTDIFERMPTREQTLLLVHEKVRARKQRASDTELTAITNGVRVALHHFYLQEQGTYVKLSEDEKRAIKRLYRVLFAATDESNGSDWFERRMLDELNKVSVSDYGAIVHKNAKIAPSAILGIGTLALSENIEVAEGAVIRLSKLCRNTKNCFIGSNSKIEASTIGPYYVDENIASVKIGANNLITKSVISHRIATDIGDNNLVANSELGVASAGNNNQITKSYIHVEHLGSSNKISGSSFGQPWDKPNSKIADNNEIRNTSIGTRQAHAAYTIHSGLRIADLSCVEFGTSFFLSPSHYNITRAEDLSLLCQ
jgi:hypothetical protein